MVFYVVDIVYLIYITKFITQKNFSLQNIIPHSILNIRYINHLNFIKLPLNLALLNTV